MPLPLRDFYGELLFARQFRYPHLELLPPRSIRFKTAPLGIGAAAVVVAR